MDKIKVAKQLVKLAKSLIANDIDEQTKVRLEEAEKSGKKYILHHGESNIWRIMACKDFDDVKKGDFGGLIESEKNLSHDGNCWIYDEAWVYEDAQVYGNAKVYGSAQVYGRAMVFGDAKVYGHAFVRDEARIYGNAIVRCHAKVYGKAQVYDDAWVRGTARIYGNAKVDYDVTDEEITE